MCDKCGFEKTELLTSWVCDNCDGITTIGTPQIRTPSPGPGPGLDPKSSVLYAGGVNFYYVENPKGVDPKFQYDAKSGHYRDKMCIGEEWVEKFISFFQDSSLRGTEISDYFGSRFVQLISGGCYNDYFQLASQDPYDKNRYVFSREEMERVAEFWKRGTPP